MTSNYFDVLGVRPILGRNFLPNEEEGADVAMVTENFWQKRLGGDPNVIGRSITLDGTPHTIVGVLPNMPALWFGPNPFVGEVWTTKPFQLPGFSYERMMRGTGFLRVIGRMKPGSTVEQVRAALPTLEQNYRAHYSTNIDSTAETHVKTLPQDVTENFAPVSRPFSRRFVLCCSSRAAMSQIFCWFVSAGAVGKSRSAWRSVRRAAVSLGCSFGRVCWSASLPERSAPFVAWRLVPLVPKMASNFLPLEGNTRQQPFA